MTKNEYLWKRADRLRAAAIHAKGAKQHRNQARHAARDNRLESAEHHLGMVAIFETYRDRAVKAVLDLDAAHPDLFARYVWIGRPTRAEARATA